MIAIVSAVATLVTAAWAFEDRYNNLPQIQEIHIELVEYANQAYENRIDDLEDKIFLLDMKEAKGIATPEDKALNRRYKSRLRDLRNRKKTSYDRNRAQ